MAQSYKSAYQNAISNAENYKKEASFLISEVGKIISGTRQGAKTLCTDLLTVLKDGKVSTTSKLLAMLIFDDATDYKSIEVLQTVNSSRNLCTFFEQAVKSDRDERGMRFSRKIRGMDSVDPPLAHSITSYMWKWSSYCEERFNLQEVTTVRSWRTKHFSNGFIRSYNEAKYMVYRPPGTLIDDATLIIGGLFQGVNGEGNASESLHNNNGMLNTGGSAQSNGGIDNKSAPQSNVAQSVGHGGSQADNLANQNQFHAQNHAGNNFSLHDTVIEEQKDGYSAHDADGVCFALLTDPGNTAKREEAMMMISYFQNQLDEAADTDQFEMLDTYIETLEKLNHALKESIELEKKR